MDTHRRQGVCRLRLTTSENVRSLHSPSVDHEQRANPRRCRPDKLGAIGAVYRRGARPPRPKEGQKAPARRLGCHRTDGVEAVPVARRRSVSGGTSRTPGCSRSMCSTTSTSGRRGARPAQPFVTSSGCGASPRRRSPPRTDPVGSGPKGAASLQFLTRMVRILVTQCSCSFKGDRTEELATASRRTS